MCDPITVFTVIMGVAAAGSAKKSADDVAEIEEDNAQLAEEAAAKNAAIERKEATRLKARQRVAFLTSGVRLAGTPGEVLAATSRDEEFDALAILDAGRIKAASHRASAAAARRRGKGGVFGAFAKIGSAFV